jgi:protease-4
MGYGDEKFVLVTTLRGVVLKHDAECGPRGTRTLANRMKQGDKDPQVIGHLFINESGGGMASAVPEMSDAIKSLTKPIVGLIDGISASASYYMIVYTQHIMASRESDLVGCIGVLMETEGFPKYSKLPDGRVRARIYADGSEEKNDEYEAALEGNFTLIKERMLNPLCEQFKADVKTNRPAVVDSQLKGRTYKASEVVGTLIDSIGTFEDAVAKVIELANLPQGPKVNSSKPQNIKTMNELKNLNAIASVKDFEVLDGHASFNEGQLEDIEAALVVGAQASEKVTQLEADKTTLTETVSANETAISAKDARITELETNLAAATGQGAADDSSIAPIESDNGGKPGKVDAFADSMAYCENHLKKNQ